MATEVKRRRGTTAQHEDFIGAEAEITVDIEKYTLLVHDDSGSAPTGHELLRQDFSNVTTLKVDTTYSETGNETQGTLYWNSDEETISLVTNGESFELGQKTEIHVRNNTGSQINKGEVVYASGTVGNSGRILISKMIADGTVGAKRIMGVAAENIANSTDGKIITFGKLKNINTSSFSDGDILYVSPTTAGAFQNTEPSQANGHVSLPIAYVIHAHSNGQIFIRVTPIDENEYQDYNAGLTDIAGLTPSDSNFIVGDGTNWVAESGATALASLGAQAQDPQLDDIAVLTPTDGNFIVGNGSNFVAESGNTARTSLGLGTADSPTFNGLTSTGVIITDEIDTTSITWNVSTQVWNATPSEKFNNPVFISTSLDVDNGINADQHVHAGTYLKADTYLEVGTSATIGTTLNVTGATTLNSTLSVTGNTTISGTLDAPTLNTGQGDNELYAMNQNVQTSDSVTFDTLAVTNNATVGGLLTLAGAADFNSTMNLQGDLTTQSNLQDDGYATGWSGTNWQIQADGSAELQELRVRGALRVFEFIAKQISTIGGSEILSIANGRVESVDNASTPKTITIDNVGSPATSFQAGDLWIIQEVDINSGSVTSVYGEVDAVQTDTNANVLEVSITNGDLSQVQQGNIIVAYGNTSVSSRQNIMYRNVDASEDNLIMRLQTGITDFSELQDEANTSVAFGDLNGYSGLISQTFGFFAGDNSNEHILVTDGGLFLKDGASTLAQLTSNTFKVGGSTNFLSFDGTTFDIQTASFNLNTATLDISSANQNIVIGTGTALITLGRIDSNNRGIKIDSDSITNENYWKLTQDNVLFKVGNGTNFLSFNEGTGTFKIKSEVFDLNATTLVIDSATNSGKIALGATTPPTAYNSGTGVYFDGTGKALIGNASGNKIQFNGSSIDIDSDTFNLETSTIQLGNSIELTSSEITSSNDYSGGTLVFRGLFNDTHNYFGYLEDVDDVVPDGYVFRAGDATNFMELNTSNNVAQINFDTFDLTSGNLRIKSTGTTYPAASANTEVVSADVSDFRIATLSNGFNTNSLAINNNKWVKFQFDYSQSVPGSFTAGITVTLEVSTDNSTFTDYGLFSNTRIDFNTNYFFADNATGNRLSVVDQSDSTKTSFRFKSSQTSGCTGTITMYFYVNEKDTTTHIRFNVLDSAGNAADDAAAALNGAEAENLGTRDYNPVTELNPSGIFTRLSDSLILSNGNTYIDYSEIT